MDRLLQATLFAVFCGLYACAAFAGAGPQKVDLAGPAAAALPSVSSSAAFVRPAEASAGTLGPDTRNEQTTIPNVELVTHDDRKVRLYDDLVKGKIVLMNFMFTSCEAYCPLTTANLARVQAALGDRVGRDVFLYSITLDPDIDTPEVLSRYRTESGAKPGWIFLTGAFATIEKLRRKLGVYDLDPVIDADKTKHSGVVVYGSGATDRWAAMPSLANAEFIAKTVLRLAPADAADGARPRLARGRDASKPCGRDAREGLPETPGHHHHRP